MISLVSSATEYVLHSTQIIPSSYTCWNCVDGNNTCGNFSGQAFSLLEDLYFNYTIPWTTIELGDCTNAYATIEFNAERYSGDWEDNNYSLYVKGWDLLGQGLWYPLKINGSSSGTYQINSSIYSTFCGETFPSNNKLELYANGTDPFYNYCVSLNDGFKFYNATLRWYEERLTTSENSVTYNPITYSSKSETFSLNFSYDDDFYNNIKGYLVYNGTIYQGSLNEFSGYSILTRTINVPSTDTQTNYSFYWVVNLTHDSTVETFNSNTYNQTVNNVNINLCNGAYNQSYINFSILNSLSPYQSINSTFNIYFEYGVNSTENNYSYSNIFNNQSIYSFCFLPSDLNYTINAQIGYESTGYAKNYYYINNMQVSNQSQVIYLYLLNDSLATVTQLQVLDKSQSPLENVYIEIQRYDLGTDTYYLVAMAKSNYDGLDISYLNWYDTLYKFILKQNGTIVQNNNPYKISETPQTFIVGDDTTFDYDKFDNIGYSLTFNNNTKNFILTYSSSDSSVKSYCLRVIKRNVLNDTIICNTCETSSSATLYCNILTSGNGTFIASFYATGSYRQIEILSEIVGSINQLYDEIGKDDGAIYAVILGLIILVVFFVSPALGIIGALIGLVVNFVFGFIPIEPLTFTGIVIAGGIIIWLLKR
jgi:hypothetical protein